jgi:hypothetical protein
MVAKTRVHKIYIYIYIYKPRRGGLGLKAYTRVWVLPYTSPGTLGHEHESLNYFFAFFFKVKYKFKKNKLLNIVEFMTWSIGFTS